MPYTEATPYNARPESEIFEEMRLLCSLPGFIHAIAYFCWRDNLIRFSGNELSENDLQHQYSQEQLIRTEIATLIGLLAKSNIDTALPTPEVLQGYVDRSEALLHEMHMSLQKPWVSAFKEMARSPGKAKTIDPFGTAEGLREPIFYGGESAYNFQYEELARQKYQADSSWLDANVGFNIDEACTVVHALGNLQLERTLNLRKTMALLPSDKWTFLPGFAFTIEELATKAALSTDKTERVISAFRFAAPKDNSSFASLSDFNETNAAPILSTGDGSHYLFQHYSLLEALYEAPFFWMAADKQYRSTASKNRGDFAENFLTDRLTKVFGAENVFPNVDIYKGKDRIAEADVLVVYGSQTVIFQAKSKRLTIEARKGNDLQLKDDFKKAILDAYDQCQLCSGALLGDAFKFVSRSNDEIKFPIKPTHIFPICIVSDHYPALSAQARQFLKISTTKVIQNPIVSDVFFIDVLTEILDTPLHFLNYLSLRAKFDGQLLVSQELTTLGYHLKHNLWLEKQYDMVNLGDDFTSSIDVTMSVRRLGLPGPRTPKGLLSRFEGTPIGRLLTEVEEAATPELVGLGMLLLQLGSITANHINDGLKKMFRIAAADGLNHDFSIPAEQGKSGLTVHVNSLPEQAARDGLFRHCKLRKYDTKSDSWFGLWLRPGDGRIQGALALSDPWQADPEMEKVLAAWPRKPLMPIESFSAEVSTRKLGRNDLCPCGSGRKHKKCCLK